ncbi:MAG: hypothetical protein AAF921_04930 [Cyanobacteria bacterium P01_D01_bin.44]
MPTISLYDGAALEEKFSYVNNPNFLDPGDWESTYPDSFNDYLALHTQYTFLVDSAKDRIDELLSDYSTADGRANALQTENERFIELLDNPDQLYTNYQTLDSSFQTVTTVSGTLANALARAQLAEQSLQNAQTSVSTFIKIVTMSEDLVSNKAPDSEAVAEVQTSVQNASDKQDTLLANIGTTPTDPTVPTTGTGLLMQAASLIIEAQTLIGNIATVTDATSSDDLLTNVASLESNLETQVSELLDDLETIATEAAQLAADTPADSALDTTVEVLSDITEETDNWSVVSALFEI